MAQSKPKIETKEVQECYCIKRVGSGYSVYNQFGDKLTEENMFQICLLQISRFLKKEQSK